MCNVLLQSANIVPEMVSAMFTDPAAEAPMAAAVKLFANRSFVPTMKAIMAAKTGHAGWQRVRAPLSQALDGAGLWAQVQAIVQAKA